MFQTRKKKGVKRLSAYNKPRLTLFGNAVDLVKSGDPPQQFDGACTRTKQNRNNG